MQDQTEYSRIVLPDEIINELILWREMFSKGYFRLGDIACRLSDQYAGALSDTKTSKEDLYNTIGRYVGKSGRTIRYYAEVAEFFPQSIRDEYSALPFSTFAKAKEFADWKAILDIASSELSWSIDRVVSYHLSTIFFHPDETDSISECCQKGQLNETEKDGNVSSTAGKDSSYNWSLATSMRKAASLIYDAMTISGKLRRLLPDDCVEFVQRFESILQDLARAIDDYSNKRLEIENKISVDIMD